MVSVDRISCTYIGVQDLPDEKNLLCLDLDVGGLPLSAPQGLVDHDPRVGEGAALPFGPGPEQKGAHAGRHAEAHGGHIAGDVLHGVVDRHTRRDGSTRGIDVEGDILGGILVGQVEQLRHQYIGHFVVHSLPQQQDPILQEAADNIHLTVVGIDYWHADRVFGRLLVGVLAAWVDLKGGVRRGGEVDNATK